MYRAFFSICDNSGNFCYKQTVAPASPTTQLISSPVASIRQMSEQVSRGSAGDCFKKRENKVENRETD